MTSTRAAVTAYLAALNAHDPDLVAARVTDDFVNEHTSDRGTSVVGRVPYRARLGAFLAMFADLHYDLEEVLVDGDRAAVAYRMTAAVDREHGPPAPIEVRGMFRFVVRDGLVAARADYWDGEVVARQLAATEATTGRGDGRHGPDDGGVEGASCAPGG